ncbi:recombination regulator RecX [Streptococcus cuniculipharyngis]|uniref:Regulatory protein RecX n=1 Tax=Streptococcus cuniculipharyngis TaxID=1562651 RepID=A0A5C5S9Q6_9STRE|nr:recombination regulator RecX [Streptococcus cuniculipharyngis]TWS96185.1 recombination regulator RecX [Streptococcus cuniculipharyngis]
MKITKLEKKKRLYLLEIDGTDKLYITEDSLVRFMLSKGKVLTQTELEELKDYNQFSLGRGLALYYLSFRQRTRAEVSRYLLDHDIEEKALANILDYLTQHRFIDDNHYAKTYIEQQSQSGDKGPYVIKQKLHQKGIAADLIDSYLNQVDFTDSLEKLAQKLYRKYSHRLPNKALEQKLLESMRNKGFSHAQAKEALEELDLNNNEEEELELLYKELDKQYRKFSRKYEDYQLKQKLYQALLRKGYQSNQIQTALREYL